MSETGTSAAAADGSNLRLTVLGSGDAFASGGRLQTAFHLATPGGEACLVDCGATVLTGLVRAGLDANRIGAVLLTHLHGDHFAGLVFLMLHAAYITRRTQPLTIVGPAGTEARLAEATEALYPGATKSPRRFPVNFAIHDPSRPQTASGFAVAAFEVDHPAGAPSYALRVAAGGRTFAYSGDTQWTEALVAASADADLFVVECSSFASEVPYHLSWSRLKAELPRLTAARVLLTHMGPQTLARLGEIADGRVSFAHDGLVIDI